MSPSIPFPAVPTDSVAVVDVAAMREVDRMMMEDVGIDLVRMMENAGRNLADLASIRFAPRSVQIMAGPGGNGGGGLVAARHLANRGFDVRVTLSAPDALTGVPAAQRAILDAMDVAIVSDPAPADLVIDALVGYSIEGDLRGATADLAAWSNGSGRPILSLDLASGLDPDGAAHAGNGIVATATMTLASPKAGQIGHARTGELYLADISVPAVVYRRIGIDQPPFRLGPILALA